MHRLSYHCEGGLLPVYNPDAIGRQNSVIKIVQRNKQTSRKFLTATPCCYSFSPDTNIPTNSCWGTNGSVLIFVSFTDLLNTVVEIVMATWTVAAGLIRSQWRRGELNEYPLTWVACVDCRQSCVRAFAELIRYHKCTASLNSTWQQTASVYIS